MGKYNRQKYGAIGFNPDVSNKNLPVTKKYGHSKFPSRVKPSFPLMDGSFQISVPKKRTPPLGPNRDKYSSLDTLNFNLTQFCPAIAWLRSVTQERKLEEVRVLGEPSMG